TYFLLCCAVLCCTLLYSTLLYSTLLLYCAAMCRALLCSALLCPSRLCSPTPKFIHLSTLGLIPQHSLLPCRPAMHVLAQERHVSTPSMDDAMRCVLQLGPVADASLD
ncbi:hypothetical protein COCVIDRAFT_111747, partial [Bipolaris victoriae FI3]